ncbi:MAG TPA: protein kinase [Vicinamibacterales bacterium]
MPLAPGTHLGAYEILGLLGTGAMGEVYRARDPRLNREVALKIVPEDYAFDARRRERFRREAQAIAALSHPNIVTVFSAEDVDGHLVLAMELVEGRTLADLAPRGGMPLPRLLKIAVQIADALGAAHDRGVTHRDLKPRNVMVAADGRVKVLDFGLAKLREVSQESLSPSSTAPLWELTGEGRIVGTAAYMSPEQAEGRPVDHRTDLFALGIVLYELSTGERPFQGESIISVLSSIVRDTPRPLTEVNPRLPREFNRIVRRLLAKDPEERYQSAKDVRHDLEDLRLEITSGELTAAERPAPPGGRRRRRALLAAGTVLAIAAAGAWYARRPRPPLVAPRPVAVQQLTFEPGVESSPSISPDGRWVVYSRRTPGSDADIYLQAVGGDRPINLTEGSGAGNGQPAFSPDGEHIAFRSGRQGSGLFVMGRTGDFVRRVTDTGYSPAWSPDGKRLAYSTSLVTDFVYAYAGGSNVWVVDLEGGGTRRLTTMDAVQPAWSPGGHRIAFWGVDPQTRNRDLWTVSVDGTDPVRVTNDPAVDATPAWSPDGRFLYFSSTRGGTLNLWRVAVDERTGRPLGEPEPVTVAAQNAVRPSLSRDGRRLAYGTLTLVGNVFAVAFDAARGTARGEPAWLFGGPHHWSSVRASPDGQRLAAIRWSHQQDLFISRNDGSELRRLTQDEEGARCPAFSPDGREIAYLSARRGDTALHFVEVDGGRVRRRTDIVSRGLLGCPAWAADGRMALVQGPEDPAVFVFDPSRPWADQTIDRLPPAPGGSFFPRAFSPDGRLLVGTVVNTLVTFDLKARRYDRRTTIAPVMAASHIEWVAPRRLLTASTAGAVLLVDLDARRATEVLPATTDTLRGFALAPDGSQLYVSRGPEEGDVWLAVLR